MEAIERRHQAESRTRQSAAGLLTAAAIWRTSVWSLAPGSGSACWWIIPLCAVPGVLMALAASSALKCSGVQTLPEAFRKMLGRRGASLWKATLALLLLAEALMMMTALITFFTRGIGTQGTPLTLALLSGGVLIACMHRDGLPRGIFLVRWVLVGAGLIAAVDALLMARWDHIFPIGGEGAEVNMSALLSGSGMAWPLTLFHQEQRRHLTKSALPLTLAAGVVFPVALLLMFPHEWLLNLQNAPEKFTAIIRHLHPGVHTLCQCLWMLMLFLGCGVSLHHVSELADGENRFPWLPWLLVAATSASQAADACALVAVLRPMIVFGWMIPAFLLLILLLVSFFKRERGRKGG